MRVTVDQHKWRTFSTSVRTMASWWLLNNNPPAELQDGVREAAATCPVLALPITVEE